MIDTHCHIDLYKAPLEIAQTAERNLIRTVAVTYLPSHYQLALQHLKGFRYVVPALGLHPMAAKDHSKEELRKFCQLVKDAALIGEIGLDFSHGGKATRSIQEDSFSYVLDHLKGKQRFITLHSRRAEDAVLSHLTKFEIGPVVFHWFSGNRGQLIRVLDAGHYVSLNTSMVQSNVWRDLLAVIPRNRVLTESDGPFCLYEEAPATPMHMSIVHDWLGAQWGVSSIDVQLQIEQTFLNLLPLGSALARSGRA